jgi:hypothetical protein
MTGLRGTRTRVIGFNTTRSEGVKIAPKPPSGARGGRSYEIYRITCPGFWYVGSTAGGATTRFKEHVYGQPVHGHYPSDRSLAPLLAAKVAELGHEAFTIEVIERGRGNQFVAEQRWTDHYTAEGAGESLNIGRAAGVGRT